MGVAWWLLRDRESHPEWVATDGEPPYVIEAEGGWFRTDRATYQGLRTDLEERLRSEEWSAEIPDSELLIEEAASRVAMLFRPDMSRWKSSAIEAGLISEGWGDAEEEITRYQGGTEMFREARFDPESLQIRRVSPEQVQPEHYLVPGSLMVAASFLPLEIRYPRPGENDPIVEIQFVAMARIDGSSRADTPCRVRMWLTHPGGGQGWRPYAMTVQFDYRGFGKPIIAPWF